MILVEKIASIDLEGNYIKYKNTSLYTPKRKVKKYFNINRPMKQYVPDPELLERVNLKKLVKIHKKTKRENQYINSIIVARDIERFFNTWLDQLIEIIDKKQENKTYEKDSINNIYNFSNVSVQT